MNTVFGFNGMNLRTIDLDGQPWFVAADACRILGLSMYAGTQQHLSRLVSDERRVVRRTGGSTPTDETRGGLVWNRGEYVATLISESGLYKLIMRSDKPDARAFQDWVTREVLPSIRKSGSYALAEGQQMPLPADVASAFVAMEERIKAHIDAKFGELLTPSWIDRQGKDHRLADMTDEHLRNARKFADPYMLAAIEAELRTRRAAAAAKLAEKKAKVEKEAARIRAAAEKKAKALLATIS